MSEKSNSGKGNIANSASREAKIGAWWSAQAEKQKIERSPRLDWLCSPVIEKITHRRISKEEETNWIGFVRTKLANEHFELGLSIGCGAGDLERDVVTHKFCQRMEAVDIAQGALEIARRQAWDLPIKYIQGDLETMNLPSNRYDIAFCASTLHHLNKLDHCLSRVYGSLKKEGFFAFFEYVGPSRFQWEPYQLRLVNDLYSLLPEEYHFNHGSRIMQTRVIPPGVSLMIQNDPSEAARSNELLGAVDRYFETLYKIELGGTLLNPLLGGICENFKDNNEMDISFLRLAALYEESLIEAGVIPSDFVVMLCKKREKPLDGADALRAEHARSETVSRQEAEIVSLCQRIFAAEAEVEKLLERLNEERARLEAASRAIEEQQPESQEPKKGFLFRIAKAARRTLKKEKRSEKVGGDAQTSSSEDDAGAEAEESHVSPEIRAIKSCIDGSRPYGEYLWLHWVRELIGASWGKALLATPDPALACALVSAGVCGSVSSGLSQKRGNFSVVFLDISSESDFECLPSTLGEDGVLVAFSRDKEKPKVSQDFMKKLADCLPKEWAIATKESAALVEGKLDTRKNKFSELPEALPEDFNLAGLRSFGNLFNPLFEGHRLNRGMEKSVAGLLMYIELSAVELGLVSSSITVGVFKKGLAREEGGQEFSADIVEIQQREVERLEASLREKTAYKENLESELEKLVEAVDRTKTVLEHPLH